MLLKACAFGSFDRCYYMALSLVSFCLIWISLVQFSLVWVTLVLFSCYETTIDFMLHYINVNFYFPLYQCK